MPPSQHRLPALAARLRVNRGFESAWYSDTHYPQLLQKDWLLSKNAWSLMTRASRSKPKQNMTLGQTLQSLQALREAQSTPGGKAVDAKALAAAAVAASQVGQAQGLAGCDYPNLRVGRVFTQQLPYKSIVSTFSYAVPAAGAQAKYGLLPNTSHVVEPKRDRDGSKDREGQRESS